jgi:hypothetical protein
LIPKAGQLVRCGQSGLLSRIRSALYTERLVLLTLKSCTFTKKKVVFFTLCRFFSTDCLCFCWLLGATFGPPSHATFWSKHQMFEL